MFSVNRRPSRRAVTVTVQLPQPPFLAQSTREYGSIYNLRSSDLAGILHWPHKKLF